jgi:hypothetical protein
MAVSDDLRRLAAEDVVYLSRITGSGPSEVFRGRLRQALDGSWVFNASMGQNGVVGFNLGQAGSPWSSFESPATGVQVSISYNVYSPPGFMPLLENIFLTTVIPAAFSE